MPRSFFDQVLVVEKRQPGRRWLKTVSLVLHVALLVVIMVLPITAALELPNVYTQLPTFMLASVPSPPPEPAAPTVVTRSPTVVATIPTAAPEGVTPEPDRPLTPSSLTVPGALPTSGASHPSAGVLSREQVPLSDAPPKVETPPRRVGGIIRPPTRTRFVEPDYPAVAKAARVGGVVILEATIDAQGVVQNVRVLRSVPLLDRAAIAAVTQWRYTPTRLNGVAIPIIMTVTVSFAIR